jgi:hypothetical protein
MDIIKPKNYIRLQRKICNAKAIIAANKIAAEKGITPEEACYFILSEALTIEYNKRLKNS